MKNYIHVRRMCSGVDLHIRYHYHTQIHTHGTHIYSDPRTQITVPVATKSLGIRCSYEAGNDCGSKLLVQDVDPRGPIGQTQNIRAGDEIVMVKIALISLLS